MKESSTLDLGYKDPFHSATVGAPATEPEKAKDEPKTIYPSLSIEQQPELVEALEVGQEVTATVRMRVVGLSNREGGRYTEGDRQTADFDVISAEFHDLDIKDSGDKEEGAEEAIEKHFKKKE